MVSREPLGQLGVPGFYRRDYGSVLVLTRLHCAGHVEGDGPGHRLLESDQGADEAR